MTLWAPHPVHPVDIVDHTIPGFLWVTLWTHGLGLALDFAAPNGARGSGGVEALVPEAGRSRRMGRRP